VISWRFRKSKSISGVRATLSKSRGRRPRLTASKKIGPISISSNDRVNLTLWGITVPIKRGRR
jgi:hypothetical protein